MANALRDIYNQVPQGYTANPKYQQYQQILAQYPADPGNLKKYKSQVIARMAALKAAGLPTGTWTAGKGKSVFSALGQKWTPPSVTPQRFLNSQGQEADPTPLLTKLFEGVDGGGNAGLMAYMDRPLGQITGKEGEIDNFAARKYEALFHAMETDPAYQNEQVAQALTAANPYYNALTKNQKSAEQHMAKVRKMQKLVRIAAAVALGGAALYAGGAFGGAAGGAGAAGGNAAADALVSSIPESMWSAAAAGDAAGLSALGGTLGSAGISSGITGGLAGAGGASSGGFGLGTTATGANGFGVSAGGPGFGVGGSNALSTGATGLGGSNFLTGGLGSAGSALGGVGAAAGSLLGGGSITSGLGTIGSFLGNNAGTLLNIGGTLLSGYLGSQASDHAADAEIEAAKIASATQLGMYNQNREDLAPWRNVGGGAINKLGGLYGIGPDGKPLAQGAFGPDQIAEFERSPDYAFAVDQGQKAVDRSAAARGHLYSGAQMQANQKFGQGLGTQNYNNYANRLAALAGVGQSATTTTGEFGQNAANNIAQNQMAQGNARASGYLGGANSWANAINNGLSFYGNQQQTNALNNWFGR